MMFGFISKKKLYKEVNRLYQLNNAEKAYSNEDWYFRCGCANVCNYLCSKFNLPKLKEPKEGGAERKETEDEQS